MKKNLCPSVTALVGEAWPGILGRAGLVFCMVFLTGCPFRIHAQIITTIAGNGSTGYTGDGGAAVSATFNSPTSVSADGFGNVYVNDQQNNCVRKVGPSGIITTIAGKGPGSAGYTGDNGPATDAELSSNWGVAADAAGNVYIADQSNNCIRKVNTSGIITTIAGTGTGGFGGDGGAATAALLHYPIGIAVDGAGNIYVGDASNWRIRMINTSGIISTIAGTGSAGYSGDGGPALSARLGNTFGLAVDGFGNVYICDGSNNRVRMVTSSGTISTVAGTGVPGYNMDGIAATAANLDEPTGVFMSTSGDLYIADYSNNRIRRVNSSGIISTIAGTGVPGFLGDGDLAVNARLSNPVSVTLDASNTITYLADFSNVRIRMISNANLLYFTGGKTQSVAVCENTTHDPINALLAVLDHDAGLTDTWSLLYGPHHGYVFASYTATATGTVITPAGLYYTPAGGYAGNDTFTVRVTDGLAADTTTIYVTVNPLVPSAGAITGSSNVCEGSSIILSETVRGGTWSTNNNAAVLMDSLVIGIHTGFDTVTYTVTNPCGVATITKIISINPLPYPGIITGTDAMCIGSSVILTDTVSGGIWNTSNSLAAVVPTTAGSIVTGLSHGTDTILYTVTSTLCEATAKFVVRVDTFPDAGIIVASPGVCAGSYIILTDTVAGGVWSSSNANATLKADTLTGVLTGLDTISYSVTNTCGTAVATQIIIIKPRPDKPVITLDESVLTVPAGYTSYQWALNGNSISGAIADSYTVATTGLYDATVTNSLGCAISASPVMCYGCTPDDIKIYPNPSTSIVYIDWCKKVTIRIICADGKTIGQFENTNKIDLGALPDGAYFLSIFDTNGKKVKTKKVIKITQ